MENPTTSQEGPPKKGPLDNLSREELIKKCKGLLGIAQKAKQAKDEYAEENRKLQEELNKYETQKDADKKSIVAMKEIVESLTENKLILTTQLADQKAHCDKLQSELQKFQQISIENEALKRQIKRLGDENEELLVDLDAMEKKLEQVNQFGIQQQKDLVLLEKETIKWKNLEETVDELRKQLQEKTEKNQKLIEKCTTLQQNVAFQSESAEETEMLKANLESSKTSIANLEEERTLLLERLASNSAESSTIETYREKIESQTSEIEQLKCTNDKHIARLQLLKSKIIDFSSKLKKLKKSREILIETVQEYAQSVPKWQKQIMNASQQISNQLLSVESERKRLSDEVEMLRQQLKLGSANLKDQSLLEFAKHIQELYIYCENACSEYSEKVEQLRTKSEENNNLQSQLADLNDKLVKITCDDEEKAKDIQGLQVDIAALTDKLNKALTSSSDDLNVQEQVKRQLYQAEFDIAEKAKQLDISESSLQDITAKYSKATEEIKERKREVAQLREEIASTTEMLNTLKTDFDGLSQAAEKDKVALNETIQGLQEEVTNKSGHLRNLEQEKNNLLTSLDEKNNQLQIFQSSLSARETEHSDLLAEMRELNEAFKGRGDVISRQQEKITEFEAKIRDSTEKLAKIESNLSDKDTEIVEKQSQITSMNHEIKSAKNEVNNLMEQAKQNERIIKNLSDEMTTMRERHQHDNQSDAISTSTISRVDEVARMKEIDESLEEKYNKLRALALKLKKKVQEQATHIASLESETRKSLEEKHEATPKIKVKNLQALQNENDKLLDEVEKLKAENQDGKKRIAEFENEFAELKNVSTVDKTSKTKFDTAIKEYQNQIKSLKQEKDSLNLIQKEIEKERDALKTEIVKKSEEMTAIKAQCDKLKSELERKKSAEKKSSVLNLEIEAYEKSLNDVTEKYEKSKGAIKELKDDITSKEATISSLNSQIQLLEQSIESEKMHSIELKQQIDIQHAKFKENEHEKLELRTLLQDKTQECESLKNEINELQLQLSTIASDREKLCSSLQVEKDKLLRQVFELEESLEEVSNKLKSTEHELEDLRTEYASYKVKAQSVLRQNQSKETGRERELDEELETSRKTIENLNSKIKSATELLNTNERKLEESHQDNERIQKRCKDLIQLLEESRLQTEQLNEENRKQNADYQESLKSHRFQIETINNCYKTQIDDMEKKYKSELEDLRNKNVIVKDSREQGRPGPFGGPINDEQKIDLILMEREAAEGSEATSTGLAKRKISSARSRREPMPLDELLNSTIDNSTLMDEDVRSISPTIELQTTKERLCVQESRVKHLTTLLAENEQDLAKLTQMNELLKEELRRQERSEERQKHIHNSEYLKNVVLKFLTLGSGDERTRLVPVLNTILKLSPDETHALQNIAKGTEPATRTWGSYLPVWSNHQ